MSYGHTEGVLSHGLDQHCESLEEGIASSFVREMLVESKAEATDDL